MNCSLSGCSAATPEKSVSVSIFIAVGVSSFRLLLSIDVRYARITAGDRTGSGVLDGALDDRRDRRLHGDRAGGARRRSLSPGGRVSVGPRRTFRSPRNRQAAAHLDAPAYLRFDNRSHLVRNGRSQILCIDAGSSSRGTGEARPHGLAVVRQLFWNLRTRERRFPFEIRPGASHPGSLAGVFHRSAGLPGNHLFAAEIFWITGWRLVGYAAARSAPAGDRH